MGPIPITGGARGLTRSNPPLIIFKNIGNNRQVTAEYNQSQVCYSRPI